MRLLLGSLFLLTSLSVKAEMASNLTVRTGAELLSNEGSRKGTSFNMGGINLIYFFPVVPRFSIGTGYMASFDMGKGSMPISGYSLHGRYYFLGESSLEKNKDQWGLSSYKSMSSYYTGGSFNYNSYFLGKDNQSIDDTARLEGKYSTLNVFAGADYQLYENYSLNLEAGMSLLTMAASDDRVKIKTTYFLMGISYFF